MKIIALFISFAMILASVTTVVSAATIGEGRTYLTGDLDHNGKVSATDLVGVMQAINSHEWNPAADVNCDGRINNSDYNMIRNIMVGNITSYTETHRTSKRLATNTMYNLVYQVSESYMWNFYDANGNKCRLIKSGSIWTFTNAEYNNKTVVRDGKLVSIYEKYNAGNIVSINNASGIEPTSVPDKNPSILSGYYLIKNLSKINSKSSFTFVNDSMSSKDLFACISKISGGYCEVFINKGYISGFSVNDDESENLTIDYYFAMG